MKRILLTIIISLTFLVPCFGVNGTGGEDEGKTESSICPKTKMKDSCFKCHSIPDWSLKEKTPEANREIPCCPEMTVTDNGKTAHLFITEINSSHAATFFEYLSWHPEIAKCVFEIHSPGGSLFEAWRIIGLMEHWKARGMVIETRCYGFAASAGFILFVNGTPGHRFAAATSELMWHELYTFAMFKVSRPSDTEDEAIILRHLQNTASTFLAERSKRTVEQWKEMVYKKEFWCNGEEAKEYGLSDGYPE